MIFFLQNLCGRTLYCSGNLGCGGHSTGSKKFVKGKDYTVELKKNWEKSGQTMMIIKLTIPDDADHRFWHKLYNRSGWKLNYTLWNPYTNIVDRGRTAKNTLGFVNTDEHTVWSPIINRILSIIKRRKLAITKSLPRRL